MFYKKFGNSEKLIVFLHGWGSDHKAFFWIKDFLEDDYSLLFLDFNGFGLSENLDKVLTLNDYVFALRNLLGEFKFKELIFVAHSFGGRVALKFLFYFQDEFEKVKLCLVDSAGLLPKRGLRYKWNVARYKTLRKKVEKNPSLKFKLDLYGSSDYKVLDPIMKKTFINIVNEDLTHQAKFIKSRTVIVWGDKDKDTKPWMARKLHRLIKDSKLIFIKNAGHFCFVEKKEEFMIILDSFLKSL